MENNSTNKNEGSSLAVLGNFLKKHRTALTIFGAILASLIAGEGYLLDRVYRIAFDNGTTHSIKEYAECTSSSILLQAHIKKLKEDSVYNIALNTELRDSLEILTAILRIENTRPTKTQTKMMRDRIISEASPPQATIPTPIIVDYEKRIKEAQDKINNLEEQCLSLGNTNSKLRATVILLNQDLQAARNYEELKKDATDNIKRAVFERLRDKTILNVEKMIAEAFPDLPKARVINANRPDTVKVADYEKQGDMLLNKAITADTQLRRQPDSYVFGCFKNKTKEVLMNSVLDLFESASTCFQNAKAEAKFESTERRIEQFRAEFKITKPRYKKYPEF